MRIPYLRIEQYLGRIGIETKKGQQTIEQPKPIVQIKQTSSRLEIERTKSWLEIDQKEAFADIGLKDIFRLTKEWAELGREAVREGTGRRAEEGDRLAAVEKEPNAIANIAYENSNQTKEFGYGWIPDYFSVKFHYQPAQIKNHWAIGGVTFQVETFKPQYTYQGGEVKIYLSKLNSIKIDLII